MNIQELLEQETVSGEETGRLIIHNDICLYKKQIGIQTEETPLTQTELDALTERINTIEDADVLECYVQLQHFVQYAQAISYAYNQQAQNGLCRLLMYMTQAQQVEHARKTLEMLPMIMTETQFKERPVPGPIARLRGVAIVANSFPCRPKCLDANDYFIEPEIDCFQEMMSLEHAETMADKIDYFRNDLLLSGLRYQLAYNKLFELIAERIDIPEFTLFCTDAEELIKQIRDFNSQRAVFEDEIAGEGEEFNNKKSILQKIFRPINLDELIIAEETIAEIRCRLEDINVFRTSINELLPILLSDGRA